MPEILKTYLTFVKAPGNPSLTAQTFDPMLGVIFAIFILFVIALGIFAYFKLKDFKKFIFGAGIFALSLVCVFGGVKAFASYNGVTIDNEINAEINSDAQTTTVLPGNMQKNCDYDVSLNSFTANYCDDITGMDDATWTFKVGQNNLYSGKLPCQVDTDIVLNSTNAINITIDGLDYKVAETLINQHVLELSFDVDQVEVTDTFDLDFAPKEIEYGVGYFNLGQDLLIEYSHAINDVTKNKTAEVLTSKGLSFSENANSDSNFLVGTVGEDCAAFEFIDTAGKLDGDTLAKADGYQIYVTADKLAILGHDNSACYFAMTTMQDIFNEIVGVKLRCFDASDYPELATRGVIEGFYGQPWSLTDRLDIVNYMERFKMNQFFYAPKDDPYHSSQWREPYPQDKLNELVALVNLCTQKNIQVTWAIHPLMHNPVNFSTEETYQADLNLIKAKFAQTYNIGVRNFCFSADDAAEGEGVVASNQIKLVKDLQNWLKDSYGISTIDFVPTQYCEDFMKGEDYLLALQQLDQNVKIMWTGDCVYGSTSNETLAKFKSLTGHDAYMWLNFPVNDYFNDHLNIGPAYQCRPGSSGSIGIVSNPMNEAQASKVAFFQVAYFAWNNFANDDECMEVWQKSFKYVDKLGADALEEIAKHNTYFTSPYHSHGYEIGESEEFAPAIEACSTCIEADTPTSEADLASLEANYNIVLNAINSYEKVHSNVGLYNEISPWMQQLKFLCLSSLDGVSALRCLNNSDMEGAAVALANMKANMQASLDVKIIMFDGQLATPKAGGKRLQPFAEKVIDYLDGKIL